MDKTSFEKAEPILERAAEAAENLLESGDLEELSSVLTELNKALGERYSVALEVSVQVFDRQKESHLPVLQTGLAGFAEADPYRTRADCTFQRYVADGEIEIVPHDRCPKCWEIWDFKFKHQSCAHCGATMGEDVKLLLDTDACPFCEDGKVSMSKPVCSKCGTRVDPKTVVWG